MKKIISVFIFLLTSITIHASIKFFSNDYADVVIDFQKDSAVFFVFGGNIDGSAANFGINAIITKGKLDNEMEGFIQNLNISETFDYDVSRLDRKICVEFYKGSLMITELDCEGLCPLFSNFLGTYEEKTSMPSYLIDLFLESSLEENNILYNIKKDIANVPKLKTIKVTKQYLYNDASKSVIQIDSIRIKGIKNHSKKAIIYFNKKIDSCDISYLTPIGREKITIQKKQFGVSQISGGMLGNSIYELYNYLPNTDKFKKIKMISVSRNADSGWLPPEYEFEYFNDYLFKGTSIDSLLNKLKTNYESNNCNHNDKIEFYAEILANITITNKNISKINDIGYYLQKCGKHYIASYIFQKVIDYNSDRTVTYINLADSLWELDNNLHSKIAYNKYLKLMKEKGLSKKIPQRVYRRLEEND